MINKFRMYLAVYGTRTLYGSEYEYIDDHGYVHPEYDSVFNYSPEVHCLLASYFYIAGADSSDEGLGLWGSAHCLGVL